MAVKTYEDNGILLSKKTIYSGDKLKITYKGLLAQDGAETIYLHAGYGSDWDNSSFIRMEKVPEGFAAETEVLEGKSLGICFKDSAENWDNNSGENYNFKVSVRSEKKAEGAKKAGDTGKTADAEVKKIKKTSAEKKTKVTTKAK